MVYVTMTDNFLSGWGKAKNKINKLVIECESQEEAEIVYNNVINRSDMKDVMIAANKPVYGKGYYVSLHDKSDYSKWFEPNAF